MPDFSDHTLLENCAKEMVLKKYDPFINACVR